MDRPYSFQDLKLVMESAETGAGTAVRAKFPAGHSADPDDVRPIADQEADTAVRKAGVALSKRDLRLVFRAAEVAAERELYQQGGGNDDDRLSPAELMLVVESAEHGATAQLRIAVRTQETPPSAAKQLRILDTTAVRVAKVAARGVTLTPEDLRLVVGAAESGNSAL